MNSEGNIMITRMSAYYMNVIIFTIASHEIFAQIIFRSRTTKKDISTDVELPQLSQRGVSNFSELQVGLL